MRSYIKIVAYTPFSKQNGFSLIELMVVVSVMALLSAFAFPSYLRFKIHAARTEVYQNLRVISTLAHSYYSENENYPITSYWGYVQGPSFDTCDPTHASSMTKRLGFSSTNCDKLRYGYTFSPTAIFGHPDFATGGVNPFSVNAVSLQVVLGTHILAQTGSPPVSARFCRPIANNNYLYNDAWLTTESGALINTQNVFSTCL